MFQIIQIEHVQHAMTSLKLKIAFLGVEPWEDSTLHKNPSEAILAIRRQGLDWIRANLEAQLKACVTIHKDAGSLTENRSACKSKINRYIEWTYTREATYYRSLLYLQKLDTQIYGLIPYSHTRRNELLENAKELLQTGRRLIREFEGSEPFEIKTTELLAS